MRTKFILAKTLLVTLLLSMAFIVYAQPTYRPVHVVFAVDTSASMSNEWQALCSQMNSIINNLEQKGISVTYEILAIAPPFEAQGSLECTGGKTVASTIPSSTVNQYEDWGPAIVDITTNYPWPSDHIRVIVAISDEGPEDGDPIDEKDNKIAQKAANIAQNNNVLVSVILGDNPSDITPLKEIANVIARPTGGIVGTLRQGDVVVQIVESITKILRTAPIIDKAKEVLAQEKYQVDFVSEPTTIPTDTLRVEVPYEYSGPKDRVLRFVFAIQKEKSGKLQSIQKYDAYVADPTGKETPASYNADKGVYSADIQNPTPGIYKAVVQATATQDAGADVVIGVGSKESTPMPAEIPEPFTLGLMGTGVAALGAYLRKRHK